VELIENNEPLPVDITGHLIYYVGPSPARPGQVIGSAGPTTSMRMDPYAPTVLAAGSKGMIGKGEMGPGVAKALQENTGVYLAAVGGAAALIARSVKKSGVVAWEELGAEAIREMEVEDFPAVVAQDSHGGNIFNQGREQYQID
jgi:fumarate hydratase subunit beta